MLAVGYTARPSGFTKPDLSFGGYHPGTGVRVDKTVFEAICSYVSERVPWGISIMGAEGEILVSSDPSRVGSKHEKAALVVAGLSDREDVSPEQAETSSIMREGCNLPIELNGKRIASVGVTAPLAEAHHYAVIIQAFINLDLEFRQQQNLSIQQLKSKNQLLHESSMVLQQVLDTIPVRVFWKDLHSRYLGCNQLFADDAGYDHPANIIGLDESDMPWSFESDEMSKAEHRIIEGGEPMLHHEEIQRREDGKLVWLRVSRVPMTDHAGDMVGFMGTYEDTTETKLALLESKAANARFRVAFNSSPMMISLSDLISGEYIDVNRRFEEVVGYKRSEALGKTSVELGIWASEEERRAFVAVIQDKGSVDNYPVLLRKKAGELMNVLATARIVNIDGVDRMLGYIEDITERKRTERALHDAKSYISNIINSMPSILIGVDASGMVTGWNREAEKVSGIDADMALGNSVDMLLPQFSIDLGRIKRAIKNHEVRRENTVSISHAGQTSYFDITIYPLVLVDSDTEGAVIRVDDISERIRIEEMMVQSEKMSSIGGLAAGMAHEINNPLAGILQNVQVMGNRLIAKTQKNEDAAAQCGFSMEQLDQYLALRGIPSMIANVTASGRRAAGIVENMLNFSRKESADYEPVEFSQLIDKTIELAANDFNLKGQFDFRRIQIKKEYPESSTLVYCHASKVQQVILNLLKNGAQAMLQNKENEQKSCFHIRLKSNKTNMVLEIEDNGPGISDVIRKRIFEPFFTTKSKDYGTGLGLSISYYIITKDHHGFMYVRSKPGEGSCFVVGLPLTQL